MTQNASRLSILINARNNTRREFDEVGGQVGGLSGKLGVAAKAAGVLGVAFAAVQLGRAAFDMGEAAAAGLRLENAFQSLSDMAGQSGDEILAAMKKASQGTVNASDLMLSANRAMLLGVADSAEEMAGLMEVAAVRAKAMGISTSQAFSDIVTGIGRMSPLILDNLGIVIDAEKANGRYAKELGVTASSLTDVQKKQALVNEVIRTSQGLLEGNAATSRDMAGDFEAMQAAIADVRQELGELFTPAAAAFARAMADAASAASDGIGAIGDSMRDVEVEGLTQALAGVNTSIDLTRQSIEGLSTSDARYAQAQQNLTQLVQERAGIMAQLRDITGDVVDRQALANMQAAEAERAYTGMGQAVQTGTGAFAGLHAALQVNIDLVHRAAGAMRDYKAEMSTVADSARSSLKSSFLGIADSIGGTEALQGYRKTSNELDEILSQAESMGIKGEEFEFQLREWVSGIQDANIELEQSLATTSQLPGAVSSVSTAFDGLKSKISGILSGSLSSGINLESILGRQDAIEEPARRLADIAVRGFASPWASYFQNEFPQIWQQLAESGNPKQTAALILRDFEAGLRPELLDRGAAIDRVRRLLLGESRIEGLAADIAAELASEFGAQFSQQEILGRAQAALGAGGGGLALVQGIVDGANTGQLPQIANSILTRVGGQFGEDRNIKRAQAIGATFMRQLFDGALDEAEGLPFWARLYAIIVRQQIRQGT